MALSQIGQADEGLEQESLRSDLESVLGVLNDREREILRLSFGLGRPAMTLEEISDSMELTRERVRQIKMKAIHKLASPGIKRRLAQYL